MTALDRLCAAEGVQGGVIHTYNRMFGEDVTQYGPDEFNMLARRMLDANKFDLCKLANKASIAHLQFNKVR